LRDAPERSSARRLAVGLLVVLEVLELLDRVVGEAEVLPLVDGGLRLTSRRPIEVDTAGVVQRRKSAP
jgi:hypothetical protein